MTWLAWFSVLVCLKKNNECWKRHCYPQYILHSLPTFEKRNSRTRCNWTDNRKDVRWTHPPESLGPNVEVACPAVGTHLLSTEIMAWDANVHLVGTKPQHVLFAKPVYLNQGALQMYVELVHPGLVDVHPYGWGEAGRVSVEQCLSYQQSICWKYLGNYEVNGVHNPAFAVVWTASLSHPMMIEYVYIWIKYFPVVHYRRVCVRFFFLKFLWYLFNYLWLTDVFLFENQERANIIGVGKTILTVFIFLFPEFVFVRLQGGAPKHTFLYVLWQFLSPLDPPKCINCKSHFCVFFWF